MTLTILYFLISTFLPLSTQGSWQAGIFILNSPLADNYYSQFECIYMFLSPFLLYKLEMLSSANSINCLFLILLWVIIILCWHETNNLLWVYRNLRNTLCFGKIKIFDLQQNCTVNLDAGLLLVHWAKCFSRYGDYKKLHSSRNWQTSIRISYIPL